jgi:adenylosuccinate lyase
MISPNSVRVLGCGLALMWALSPLTTAQACSLDRVQRLFGFEGRAQIMLDAEAAMARAQAEHGAITQAIADEISETAYVELIERDAYDEEYARVSDQVDALLNVWRRSLSDAGDEFVHYRASNADILRTATAIQSARAAEQMSECMLRTMGAMAQLVEVHKETPMIGRTLDESALPITFGQKASAWIAELGRHNRRLFVVFIKLRQTATLMRENGNDTGPSPKALEVERSFARELGFQSPPASDRPSALDTFVEFGVVAQLIARSHQNIAEEIDLLSAADVGELRIAKDQTSQTAPTPTIKDASLEFVEATRAIEELSQTLRDDLASLSEGDDTSSLLPLIAQITQKTITNTRTLGALLQGLEVDAERMRANLERDRPFAMADRVAAELSKVMPLEVAEELVEDVIADAKANNSSFTQALEANRRTYIRLPAFKITELLDVTRIDQTTIDEIERNMSEASPK